MAPMDKDLVQRMIEMAPNSTKADVARELGVTYDWVRANAKKHGVEFRGRSDTYTRYEVTMFWKSVEKLGSRKAAAEHHGIAVKTFNNILRRAKERESTGVSNFKTESLISLRRTALGKALAFGYGRERAEDFASFCMIEALSAGRGIDLRIAMLNWQNKEFGSSQTKEGKARRYGERYAAAVSPSDSGYDDDGIPDGVAVADERGASWRESMEELVQDTPELGVVARLIVLFGFSTHDIALALGIDPEAAKRLVLRVKVGLVR